MLSGTPLLEIAIRHYCVNLVQSNLSNYSRHQIDSICESGTIVDGNSYVAKVKGWYTFEEVLDKFEFANTELAKKIKDLALQLSKEEDFLLVSYEEDTK